jgi:NTE family protein
MDDASLGLVLTGGGARGAYQAGALLAVGEITNASALPFRVLSGASAGALSAAYLASRAGAFVDATRGLADLWSTLLPRTVFRTDSLTLVKTAGEWTADLGLGGLIGTGRGKALLDTSPLRALVTSSLDVGALRKHIARGRVHGLGVTATSYRTGLGVTFFDGAKSIEPWSRVTRIGIRSEIGVDHVMASSSIPLFFPAALVGDEWFSDGCIRLSTPLSPAIHMGARRILAISVRGVRAQAERAARAPDAAAAPGPPPYPNAADTAGVLLDALFLDALESDVERVTRINETLALVPPEARARRATRLERVEVLVLRPTIDPASLVLRTVERFPATVRHLFRGLGASESDGWDLLSYLAFDGMYTTRLLVLGYEDTLARADEIRAFIRVPPS